MNNNLYILMFYIGVGLIISGVVLWVNWLSLSERAHLITMTYVAFFMTMLWGLFVALYIVVAINDYLGKKLGDKRPIKQINLWWEAQFDE